MRDKHRTVALSRFPLCLKDAFLPLLSRWVPLGRNRYDPEVLLFGRGLEGLLGCIARLGEQSYNIQYNTE